MMLSIDVGILSWGKLGEGIVGNGGVDVRTGGFDNLRVCICVCVYKKRGFAFAPNCLYQFSVPSLQVIFGEVKKEEEKAGYRRRVS